MRRTRLNKCGRLFLLYLRSKGRSISSKTWVPCRVRVSRSLTRAKGEMSFRSSNGAKWFTEDRGGIEQACGIGKNPGSAEVSHSLHHIVKPFTHLEAIVGGCGR